MAEAVPKIRVTDPQSKETNSIERQDKFVGGKGDGPLAFAAKLRSGPLSPHPPSNDASQSGHIEGTRKSDAGIDPLSQHILARKNTQPSTIRSTRSENVQTSSPPTPSEPFSDPKLAIGTTTEITGGSQNRGDKKKGVSFLSRIIGNKKRNTLGEVAEDASEAGDSRPEGMDAQLFSHTIDNFGFSPKYPQPPAYIKVRTKFKKQKEFDRLFLAQELRSRADYGPSGADVSGGGPSGRIGGHNPIWATEFSKDGRYLAAGGQDKIVRVWAVISNPNERRAHEKEESGADASSYESTRLSAPVFHQKPYREYVGHTSTILDLSWSKNNFLLSSSMDKTVRLWHISRNECLCTFKHTDFVPSIQFHPKDDRFFLAGSLDTKLRLWSIPDKSVAFWNRLPDMITAVSFTPDGKTCIAGTLSGLCMFYETEGLKYQTQIHVKSTRGQNAKGSKITGIQTSYFPPGSTSGDIKLLISSNDSRVRLYNFRDKSLEVKFRGHENNSSQIRATFADDTGYVICGSEDRKPYIWSITGPTEGDKRNQRPVEIFEAHNSITTCAILAPLKTRQLLSNSEDPIYDLCNPPPVTLISRGESGQSSRAATEAGSALPTPAGTDSTFRRVAESPAYIARSAHADGNIIVTADYTGSIKVFRQDCAYQKRMRAMDAWETSSLFSKRIGPRPATSRPASIMTQRSEKKRRDSTSTQPPSERILSWRQDISHGSHGSFASSNGLGPRRSQARSVSPRKSLTHMSMASSSRNLDSPALVATNLSEARNASPKTSLSMDRSRIQSSQSSSSSDNAPPPPTLPPLASSSDPVSLARAQAQAPPNNTISKKEKPQSSSSGSGIDNGTKTTKSSNPLAVYNGQSWAFWNTGSWKEQLDRTKSRDGNSGGFLSPGTDEEMLSKKSSLVSQVSHLTLEEEERARLEGVASSSSAADVAGDGAKGRGGVSEDDEDVDSCRRCKGTKFKVKHVRGLGVGGTIVGRKGAGSDEKRLVCVRCGTPA